MGMLHQVLEPIARVAPNGLVGACLYQAGEGGEAFWVQHRVAASEGYVHVRLLDEAEQFLYRHFFASLLVPRLGVVASRTSVFAPGTIERGAKTDAIDGGTVLDGQDADAVIGG